MVLCRRLSRRWAPLVLSLTLTLPAQADDWATAPDPAPGPAEVVGSYANGCVLGAAPLAEAGDGFQSIRRDRNRFWGHPDLIAWTQAFGKQAAAKGWTVLVADMNQPKGGPMPGGHGSHQAGLDLDIWFHEGPLPLSEVKAPAAYSVVRPDLKDVNENWRPRHGEMIRMAAQSDKVERIFVNAAIKQALCRSAGEDRAWLAKVRPWWGHDAHFHVRLACPDGSPDCVRQSPVQTGDGCGEELAWWFTDEARAPKPATGEKPPLPSRCLALVKEPRERGQ